MTSAFVRIGERVLRLWALLVAWIRGSKARFADLHALRRGTLPTATGVASLHRQLLLVAFMIGGTACMAGYGLAIVAVVWSHSEPVGRVSASASTLEAPRQAEVVIAPADLTFDVVHLMIGSHEAAQEAAIGQVVAERAQAILDRDHAVAERDAAFAERDAALAADREMLIDLHARTSRTIAEIESILASTGVDPRRMIKVNATQDRTRPRGGPFVPWSDRAVRVSDGGSAQRLASLTWGVERLTVLRDVLAHMPLAGPLAQVEVFDGFGFRHDPFTGRSALHEGIELRGTSTTPVMATADGTVAFAGWHSDYGNMVEIDHGYGFTTRYAHLSKILIKAGAPVALHDQLGFVGGTGRVTAVHLHYEIRVDGRARNPVNFLKAGRHVPKADHVVAQEIPYAPAAFAGFDSGKGAPDFWRAVNRQR